MGKVVETTKKKGRPSLLDLQKRSLSQQQQQNQNLEKNNNLSPTPPRRSTRRNPNPDGIPEGNEDFEEEDDDFSGKRKEKKFKLVLRLPPQSLNPRNSRITSDSGSFASHSNGEDDGGENPIKKRKIEAVSDGSATVEPDFKPGSGQQKEERHNGLSKLSDKPSDSPLESSSGTTLPDKKMLILILDRVQKKDTYGVFSEPVDPSELPDYHDIIENPMDFSTVRKKLSSGAYVNLEQLEKDVFLICSNAMRYNAPDTIYFRQARAMQELAKKSFDSLRLTNGDGNLEEPKPIPRRGRPPGKNSSKKPVGRPPLERAVSDFSNATLATVGDNATWSHDSLGKVPVLDRPSSASALGNSFHNLRNIENHNWSDKNEYLGSAVKSLPMKLGRNPFILDENRRKTYNQSSQSVHYQEPSVLATFSGERKQLMPIGVHIEHAYSRSLARFATNLGPVAWQIASNKIKRALPSGFKFGPGWVGENEAATQPFSCLSSAATTQNSFGPSPSHPVIPCTTNTVNKRSPDQGQSSRPISTSLMAINNSPMEPIENSETDRGGPNPGSTPNLPNGSLGPRLNPHFQLNQNPSFHDVNGLSGGFGFNLASQVGKSMGLVQPSGGNFGSMMQVTNRTINHHKSASLVHHPLPSNDSEPSLVNPLRPCSESCDESRKINEPKGCSHPSWQEVLQNQKPEPIAPDLNVGFQSPRAVGSVVRVESQQPDLALQL